MALSALTLEGSSMPIVEFEGQTYDFPEETTDEEMLTFVAEAPQQEEELPDEDKQEPFAEEEVIKKDEGVRRNKEGFHVAYKDSKKIPTGGRGHRLTADEIKQYPIGDVIPDKVVSAWFKADMQEADDILTGILEDKAVHVPDEVFDILLNMAFNLGGEGIEAFDDMWAAVEVNDWKATAKEMRDSKWFKDVGNRAVRLVDRMDSLESNASQEIPDKTSNGLTPVKGGLFEDEDGTLFMVDEQGNKKEV